MLQIMNPGSTETHQMGGNNSQNIVLGCWEKTTPLIKELEQTVNFAERKCGDLMQQLSFYKQYYEKWSEQRQQALQALPEPSKKRNRKKSCKRNGEGETSSEDEFLRKKLNTEKINQQFYEKLKNKISEANVEIAQANKKLTLASFPFPEESKENKPERVKIPEKTQSEQIEYQYPNKATKSDPLIGNKTRASSVRGFRDEHGKRQISSRNATVRTSSLLRYKLRSKSLPHGVRRKFGFGSFLDVVVTDRILKKTRSRTKITSVRSVKSNAEETITRGFERGQRAAFKTRPVSRSARSARTRKRKTNDVVVRIKEKEKEKEKENKEVVKKEIKSSIDVSERKEGFPQRRVMSQNNIPVNHVKVLPVFSSVSPSMTNMTDFGMDIQDVEAAIKPPIIRKINSISTIQNPIPFTICASTSKSFNIGMNIQQVLSLIKHKKPSVSLQSIVDKDVEGTARSLISTPLPDSNGISTLFLRRPTTCSSNFDICPARQDNCDDCASVITDITDARSRCTILSRAQSVRTARSQESKRMMKDFVDPCSLPKFDQVESVMEKMQRPEDVWVVEQPDAAGGIDARSSRSRCTCFPTKQCVDYHKLLRQYTGWKLPLTKSESNNNLTSYKCPTSFRARSSSYSRSRLYPIPSQENIDRKSVTQGGGDHRNRDGVKVEINKIHNDLLNLHRKYAHLQEQISQNNLDDYEANAELEAMESELTRKESEYKDIMSFYNQFMILKEQLKALKEKQNPMSVALINHNQYPPRPKRDPRRPTPSMSLSKVLRNIQWLQDKIKAADSP